MLQAQNNMFLLLAVRAHDKYRTEQCYTVIKDDIACYYFTTLRVYKHHILVFCLLTNN